MDIKFLEDHPWFLIKIFFGVIKTFASAVETKTDAISDDVTNEANSYNLETNASEIIEKAESKLFNLSSTGETGKDFQDFQSSLAKAIDNAEAAYKREGQLSGIPTGFTDLDQLLGGLHKDNYKELINATISYSGRVTREEPYSYS